MTSAHSIASKRLLPWLVAVAFFMEAVDTTILNTAVPVVSKALGVTTLSMKSVLASYTLSLAVFIPISGWMADRFGTRRVFATAIGMFTLGSLLCGISPNIDTLVACRIIQGFGGAMMVPVGRMTLIRTFAKNELVQAMSFVGIPVLIGPMLGPIAGGLIIRYFHWRYVFFVNIPIGLFGLVMVYFHLPNYQEKKPKPLDLIGLILFGSGIALLSYVLEVFGEHTLSGHEILGVLAISFTLLLGYGVHAQQRRFPLLDLKLMVIRTFNISVSGSFIARLGIGGVPFLLPLLYQVGLNLTPVQSGLLIMPQAAGAMFSKLFVRIALSRLGYRTLLIGNTVALGLMLMMFATITQQTPIWHIILQALVYGILTSTQYTSMNTLTYADVPQHRTSAAGSIASTFQQMSVSFGVATAGLITAVFVPPQVRSHAVDMISGLHHAFIVLGAFTILSTLTFTRLRSDDGSIVSHQSVEAHVI